MAIPPRCQRQENSFTLVELLVVIAVILLLARMLFPVMEAAKRRAANVTCASNMHQLALACIVYTNDFKVYPSQGGDSVPYDTINPCWINEIKRYMFKTKDANLSVFQCPLAIEYSGGGGYNPTPTADSNYWYNGQAAGKPTGVVKRSSEAVLIDEWKYRTASTGPRAAAGCTCQNQAWNACNCPWDVEWGQNHSPTVTDPFKRFANWAFADGHVAYRTFGDIRANWYDF